MKNLGETNISISERRHPAQPTLEGIKYKRKKVIVVDHIQMNDALRAGGENSEIQDP